MSPGGKPAQAEDQYLIRQILAGDQNQYHKLVEKYQSRITNLVACITGDYNEAEDIAQKVFIKIFYALDRFDLSLPFFPWLYRITVNQCYDELRRARRKKQTSFSDLEEGETRFALSPAQQPDYQLEQESLTQLVHRLLFALPRRYRQILILKDMTDHSYGEMAEILECSLPAARLKVFRARNMLRKKMKHLVKEEKRLLSNY